MIGKPFDTRVAGVTYDGRQRILVNLLKRQEEYGPLPVELVREPSNPYDPNAVMVFLDSVQVGYIPAGIASDMAPLMDDGYGYRVKAGRVFKDGLRYSVGLKGIEIIDKEVV